MALLLAGVLAVAAAQLAPGDPGAYGEGSHTGELPWNVLGTTVPGLKNDNEVQMASLLLRSFLDIADEVVNNKTDPMVMAAYEPPVGAGLAGWVLGEVWRASRGGCSSAWGLRTGA